MFCVRLTHSTYTRGIAIAVLWVYCAKLGPSDFLWDPEGLSSWDGDQLHLGSDVPFMYYYLVLHKNFSKIT